MIRPSYLNFTLHCIHSAVCGYELKSKIFVSFISIDNSRELVFYHIHSVEMTLYRAPADYLMILNSYSKL